MKRRTIAILVVGTSALVAAATTPGDHLTIGPPSIQITGGGSSSSVNAVNDGSNALAITALAKSGCTATDDNGITANFIDHPSNMFTMATGTSESILMVCPASATFKGISRCKFDVMKGTDVLDSATQICLYPSGTPVITANPMTVNFGTVAINGSEPRTFTLSTTMSAPGVYLSIADDEGNFKFTAPCPSGLHCHDTTMFMAGTNKTIGLACTPTRSGTLDTDLYIIGENGISLNGVVRLQCNGGTTSDPDINVPNMVTLSLPVNGGVTTTPMTLLNDGPGALTISSITTAGPAWSVQSVSSPCATQPCTLPGNQMLSVQLRFDPTVIGANDDTLTILSNDPDENPATVMLNGTGEGSTLVLFTSHGDPDFIGSTTPGGSVTKTYTLGNTPATDGIMITATVSNTSDFSLDSTLELPGPGGSASFTVTCSPQSAGLKTTTLTFGADSTFGSPISFDVQCDGDTTPGTTLAANPNPIVMDEVRLGDGPRVQAVHVSTTSGTTMSVTMEPSDSPDLSNLTTTNVVPNGITMGPGADFNVTFTPTAEGTATSTISLTAGGETLTIPFTANVVKVDLQEPSDLDFGTICVGRPAPQAQTLTLREAGSAKIRMLAKPEMALLAGSPFTVTSVTPDDAGYPFDLMQNQTAVVSVQPKVQTVAMRYEDDLDWPMDVTPATRTHLSVEFLDDKGGVTPGTVDFGSAPLRQTSETKMVTIQNCGAGTLMLSAPMLDNKQFVLVTAPPGSLAPSETATAAIAFMPDKVGVQIGKLTIETSSGPLVVDLAGTGLGDGVTQSGRASLYACDCSTSDPASALLIVLALTIPLIPRRRRR
jgi:hypothetical protein